MRVEKRVEQYVAVDEGFYRYPVVDFTIAPEGKVSFKHSYRGRLRYLLIVASEIAPSPAESLEIAIYNDRGWYVETPIPSTGRTVAFLFPPEDLEGEVEWTLRNLSTTASITVHEFGAWHSYHVQDFLDYGDDKIESE